MPSDEYWTTREVSRMYRLAEQTLRLWRGKEGVGPPFVIVNGSVVRYPADEVRQWMNRQQRGGDRGPRDSTPEPQEVRKDSAQHEPAMTA